MAGLPFWTVDEVHAASTAGVNLDCLRECKGWEKARKYSKTDSDHRMVQHLNVNEEAVAVLLNTERLLRTHAQLADPIPPDVARDVADEVRNVMLQLRSNRQHN